MSLTKTKLPTSTNKNLKFVKLIKPSNTDVEIAKPIYTLIKDTGTEIKTIYHLADLHIGDHHVNEYKKVFDNLLIELS